MITKMLRKDKQHQIPVVLLLVSFAIRPMKLVEVQCAVAICHTYLKEDSHPPTTLEPESLPETGMLLNACEALVTLDKASLTLEYETRTMKPFVLEALGPSYELLLAKTCVTYLMFDDFKRGPCPGSEIENRLAGNSFLEYSALYWDIHIQRFIGQKTLSYSIMRESGWVNEYFKPLTESVHDSMEARVVDLLKHDMARASFLQVRLHSQSYNPTKDILTQESSALQVAVCFDLEFAVKSLLDDGYAVDELDSAGRTLLHFAAYAEANQVKDLLLEKGLDMHTADSNGTTAWDLFNSPRR
jgi:hypothetical protein